MTCLFSIQKLDQYSEKQKIVDGVLRLSMLGVQICCAVNLAHRDSFDSPPGVYLGDGLHDMSAGARECDCTCWLDCLTAEGLGGR